MACRQTPPSWLSAIQSSLLCRSGSAHQGDQSYEDSDYPRRKNHIETDSGVDLVDVRLEGPREKIPDLRCWEFWRRSLVDGEIDVPGFQGREVEAGNSCGGCSADQDHERGDPTAMSPNEPGECRKDHENPADERDDPVDGLEALERALHGPSLKGNFGRGSLHPLEQRPHDDTGPCEERHDRGDRKAAADGFAGTRGEPIGHAVQAPSKCSPRSRGSPSASPSQNVRRTSLVRFPSTFSSP